MTKKNILIVDDAENNLILLSDLLSELEFNINIARNAGEALQIVETKKPDLILLDIMMPGMDGFELLSTLKKQHKGIKVIFITAKSSTSDKQKAFDLGAIDFITKPVNIMDVLKKVQEIMD